MPSPDKNNFDLDNLVAVHCLQSNVPMKLVVCCQNVSHHSVCDCPLLRMYLNTPSVTAHCSDLLAVQSVPVLQVRYKKITELARTRHNCNSMHRILAVTNRLLLSMSLFHFLRQKCEHRHQRLFLLPKRVSFSGVVCFELWLKAVMYSLISVVRDHCSVCTGYNQVVDR